MGRTHGLGKAWQEFNFMRNCSGQASQGAECINNGCQSRKRHGGEVASPEGSRKPKFHQSSWGVQRGALPLS